MSSRLLIFVLGFSFSSLSFAQTSADIRAELSSFNQTFRSVSDLTTASKSTKANILSQLKKIQSEISDLDFSKEHCSADSTSPNSCARAKQNLQKRISTAIDSATHVGRYSAILIDQALTGLDTGLMGIQYQSNLGLGLGLDLVEDHPKPRKKHAKLECTPSPPNAVICNGEYFKKDNSVLSDNTVKAISEKALDESTMSLGNEVSGAAR